MIEPDDLSPQRRDAIIEFIARRVVEMGLAMPAVLFLEMHKPLSFLSSQAALFFGPFVSPFIGTWRIREASGFLMKQENIEALINRIEELAEKEGR